MFGTIESVHGKVIDKINYIKSAIVDVRKVSSQLQTVLYGMLEHHATKKTQDAINVLNGQRINLAEDQIATLEVNYNLSVISVLGTYYTDSTKEEEKTRNYYRIITGENIVPSLNDQISVVKSIILGMYKLLQQKILPKIDSRDFEYKLDDIMRIMDCAHSIEIAITIEKKNYEICKCGNRMTVIPELSELHCSQCLKIRSIIGTVFRDDQFYPQDGQKTKHGGYDTVRHYRFWIERLQALESKTFTDVVLNKIEYVLVRDDYDRSRLTCENMRRILKDPKVDMSCLNDHAPLLVKTFGGPAPPMLDFQENKKLSIRFSKAMALYDVVNPNSGNKPYYPYFIYKIIEYEFRNNRDKLRLLDYIHLQSRETVIKNDKYYEQMCQLAGDCESDGIVYIPTDPARI